MANIEAKVYNNKKCYWKKNLKSLIRFHSANKIDNYNGGGVVQRNKKGKEKKKI